MRITQSGGSSLCCYRPECRWLPQSDRPHVRKLSVARASVPGMPSQLHEVLVALFHERPALAAELLTDALGVPVPEHREVRLESCELADVTPTEYRADAVAIDTIDDLFDT